MLHSHTPPTPATSPPLTCKEIKRTHNTLTTRHSTRGRNKSNIQSIHLRWSKLVPVAAAFFKMRARNYKGQWRSGRYITHWCTMDQQSDNILFLSLFWDVFGRLLIYRLGMMYEKVRMRGYCRFYCLSYWGIEDPFCSGDFHICLRVYVMVYFDVYICFTQKGLVN